VTKASSKNWLNPSNTIVSFVPLEQLLKTKRNPAPFALMGSIKTVMPKPLPRAKRVVLDCIPSVPPPCAQIAKKASSRNWLKLPNPIVNFVPLEQLLKTKWNPAPLALMGSTKKVTPKPPRHAKRVLLVFIPSVPPPCARIATKANFKNWQKPSNTIVNFVPKQQHSIRPVAVVLHVQVVNSKNKIRQFPSRANNVPLEPNGKHLQTCVILATLENIKIKTLPIQSLVNFVKRVKNSPPKPPVVRCA
jgi:hypothetical protein